MIADEDSALGYAPPEQHKACHHSYLESLGMARKGMVRHLSELGTQRLFLKTQISPLGTPIVSCLGGYRILVDVGQDPTLDLIPSLLIPALLLARR